MSPERLRAAIALHDRFTHQDNCAARSPGGGDPVMDRRAFMAELTRIGGSAAAASMLLGAVACRAAESQIPADDARIQAREMSWEARPGRSYRGYHAAPAAAAETLPLVLVIHENRGLNEHIRDVARRFAVAGYSAVAPDFLSPAGGTPEDEDRAREMIGALDMAETVEDGAAMIRWLASPRGGGRRIGIVGFCWGGALVHRLALAAGDALGAAASFYGPAPDPAEAPRVSAPVLIHLAGRDERVNRTALPWPRRCAPHAISSTQPASAGRNGPRSQAPRGPRLAILEAVLGRTGRSELTDFASADVRPRCASIAEPGTAPCSHGTHYLRRLPLI